MSETGEEMNMKQRRFAELYVEKGNITSAALEAGYSENYAARNAYLILENPEVKAYIEKILEKIQSEKIADAAEVMKYLTSVMRGESKSETVVVEGTGEGCSKAKTIERKPEEREKLKAAELIGKRYGLFTEKIESDMDLNLNIRVDYGEEE